VTRWQFALTTLLGLICIGLSVAVIISGRSNQTLQTEIQAQQIEINRGTQSQQIASNLLRDIAVTATKDDKLKDLLTRNGFTLSQNPGPSPAVSPPAR
jgi:hypothetical protein